MMSEQLASTAIVGKLPVGLSSHRKPEAIDMYDVKMLSPAFTRYLN